LGKLLGLTIQSKVAMKPLSFLPLRKLLAAALVIASYTASMPCSAILACSISSLMLATDLMHGIRLPSMERLKNVITAAASVFFSFFVSITLVIDFSFLFFFFNIFLFIIC